MGPSFGPSFWDQFWPQTAATVIGVLLGVPLGLLLARWAAQIGIALQQREEGESLKDVVQLLIGAVQSNKDILLGLKGAGARLTFAPDLRFDDWDAVKADVLTQSLDPVTKSVVSRYFALVRRIARLNETYVSFAITEHGGTSPLAGEMAQKIADLSENAVFDGNFVLYRLEERYKERRARVAKEMAEQLKKIRK